MNYRARSQHARAHQSLTYDNFGITEEEEAAEWGDEVDHWIWGVYDLRGKECVWYMKNMKVRAHYKADLFMIE